MNKPELYLLEVPQWSILDQLRLEEALLRCDTRNWCLVNKGSSQPSIVMGISGKPELLICPENYARASIPIVRRFSGGGTVVVDENTLFVTFICNSRDTGVSCYPKQVLEWTGKYYHSSLSHSNFSIKENDYVLGNLKCGGNAQYFRKERWLHHTSFLWDYDPLLMKLLLLPSKMPEYRQKRSHADFLCKLKDHCPSKNHLLMGIYGELNSDFTLQKIDLSTLDPILNQPHRKATTVVIPNLLWYTLK